MDVTGRLDGVLDVGFKSWKGFRFGAGFQRTSPTGVYHDFSDNINGTIVEIYYAGLVGVELGPRPIG